MMRAKLLRIKLKPGTAAKARAFIQELKNQKELAYREMAAKGYYWDCIFIDDSSADTYLYIVAKSEDWGAAKHGRGIQESNPFREHYELFKLEAFLEIQEMKDTLCLNQLVTKKMDNSH